MRIWTLMCYPEVWVQRRLQNPVKNLSGSSLLPQKLQNWVLNASLEFTRILFKAFLLEEKPGFNFFLHNFAYLKNYCQGLLEKSAHTEFFQVQDICSKCTLSCVLILARTLQLYKKTWLEQKQLHHSTITLSQEQNDFSMK